MKKLLLVGVACGALAMGGCAATFGTRVVPDAPPSLDPTVGAVQDAAAKICAFVPTASTVAGIVTSFTGGGAVADLVGSVANAICASVTKKTLSRSGTIAPPNVGGVPVRGYFLR